MKFICDAEQNKIKLKWKVGALRFTRPTVIQAICQYCNKYLTIFLSFIAEKMINPKTKMVCKLASNSIAYF